MLAAKKVRGQPPSPPWTPPPPMLRAWKILFPTKLNYFKFKTRFKVFGFVASAELLKIKENCKVYRCRSFASSFLLINWTK